MKATLTIPQANRLACGRTRATASPVGRRLWQVEERHRNWEKAIDEGLNIDLAIENLKRLDGEKEALEREMALAQTRKTLDLDVQAASRETLAGLDRLEEVLEKGSVAEVKAVLRAYIGRVEYDHETNRARVGFLRLPTRALISHLAPESARISVVAGAGFVAIHNLFSPFLRRIWALPRRGRHFQTT
jgi:hypothetical protein